jgi:hypothetical protein
MSFLDKPFHQCKLYGYVEKEIHKGVYSTFDNAINWGVEKGKVRLKKDQDEYNATHKKSTFYDGYSKLDNILKRKNDIEENESISKYFYGDFSL